MVAKGSVLATVYGNDKDKVNRGAEETARAFTIGNVRPFPSALIKKIIE